MLSIVFTICAIEVDGLCETHHVPFFGPDLQCVAQAQAEIIPHMRPGWKLTRFGCQRQTTENNND